MKLALLAVVVAEFSSAESHRKKLANRIRDTPPFEAVPREDLGDFFKKNVQIVNIPTPDALLDIVLECLHHAVK